MMGVNGEKASAGFAERATLPAEFGVGMRNEGHSMCI